MRPKCNKFNPLPPATADPVAPTDPNARYRFTYTRDGRLTLDTDTTLPILRIVDIMSNIEVFTGVQPEVVDSVYRFIPDQLIVANGDSSIDFGPAMTPDLDALQLSAQLCIQGIARPGKIDERLFTLNDLAITGCRTNPNPPVVESIGFPIPFPGAAAQDRVFLTPGGTHGIFFSGLTITSFPSELDGTEIVPLTSKPAHISVSGSGFVYVGVPQEIGGPF